MGALLRSSTGVALGAAMAGWLAVAPAAGASFDCATAGAADEKAVCASCALEQLDVKMSTLYGVITKLVAMGQRGAIQEAQRAWLARRALCGTDASCLDQAYRARIGELETELASVYSRGPF
ncbi:lysozyme inhibitor LprI family protein [Xanthobacter sp. V4C-4]|uniref:lysozyme inhibitor LprI family protein n=1 Tax=Xanthobacter cornucopiae TaxID=3119924 RepID=UPI00372C77D1